MTTDITGMLAGLRGDDYVTVLREIAVHAAEVGAYVPCGTGDCHEPAVWIGMQMCGQPGGPVCPVHYQRQLEWMAAAALMGQPYCRHCDQNVTAAHVYVVPLDRSTEGDPPSRDRSAEGDRS